VPDETCYACTHVLSAARPVLYACREDGDLVLACGVDGHEQSTDDWRVVHSAHLLDLDASLTAITDLANNEVVERAAVGKSWTRGPLGD
jgi:hypothetical protein